MACVAGTFSTVAGSQSQDDCVRCSQGKFSSATGASSADACFKCVAGKYGRVLSQTVIFTTSDEACLSCEAGKYATSDGNQAESDCVPCAAGTYSMSLGASTAGTCVPCVAGKYSTSAVTPSDCFSCQAGKYSIITAGNTSSSCQDCEVGKFASSPGSTMCESCPAGTFSIRWGATSISTCKACTAGKYSRAIAATSMDTCLDCGAGKFATAEGAQQEADCEACPRGTFSVAQGATSFTACQNCVAGTFGPLTSSTSCELCELGTYSISVGASSDITCLKCAAGKYSSTRGAPSNASCTDCSKGKYLSTEGNDQESDCVSCTQGTFSTTVGATSVSVCITCGAGKFSTVMGNDSEDDCVQCSQGKFSSMTGASSADACFKCVAGKYSTVIGATSDEACLSCGTGKYAISDGNQAEVDCAPCAAGTYSMSLGASTADACVPCVAGKYSTTVGAQSISDCIVCEAGKYSEIAGADVCQDCDAGKHLETTGNSASTDCRLCAAGKYSVSTGATSSETCETCDAGKYSSAQGNVAESACIQCGTGKYSSVQGAISDSVCQDCPSGKISSAGSNYESDCAETCPQGYTGLFPSCTPCPVGTFKEVLGSAGCELCPVNTDSPGAQPSCMCKPGFTWFSNMCVSCSSGKYKTVTGNGACTSCDRGKYSAEKGATSPSVCVSCGAGKYSEQLGAWSNDTCLSCEPGKYLESDGNDAETDCVACGAGKYSIATASVSSTTCMDCSAGKYSTVQGASSDSQCLKCPAGKYSADVGAAATSVCQECSAGEFSDRGSVACQLCPEGKYSTNWAATSMETCRACGLGKYSSARGAQSAMTCNFCTPGTYSTVEAATSASTCTACGVGKYSTHEGASSADTCRECVRGKYADSEALSRCTDCEAGKYSMMLGAISAGSCLDCTRGKYSTLQGASACIDCNAGKFSVTYGARSGDTCVDCGVGKYSQTIGAFSNTTCAPCPVTTDTCVACPAGKKKPTTGATTASDCLTCPSGYTSPRRLSDCISCEAGTFSPAGSFECLSCETNADSVASSAACECVLGFTRQEGVCNPCAPGTFKPVNGDQDCTPCEIGKYSTATGATTEDACAKCPDFAPQSPAGSSSSNECSGLQSPQTGLQSPQTDAQPRYAIDMVLEMPYSRATFTREVQDKFRGAIASGPGVPIDQVIITSVVEKAAARRLLLAASIDVGVRILFASEADAAGILQSGVLSQENLNAKLESEGLEPISSIVSEPQLGSVANAPVEMKSEEASGPGVNPWAVVGILIGVLVVALPCVFIAARKVVKRGRFDHLRIVDDIPDSMPGERIDPDKLVFGTELGFGASGEVVQGMYTKNGRTIDVAIKIMPGGCRGDDLNKFAQEVQALLTASSRCNGTVKFYGICLKSPGEGRDPRLCIIMKRYKMTLAQKIRESGHGLSTKQVAKYTRQLIHTIADLHDAGIIHQDLKPDNLFVDDDDNLVVADFGISKIVNTLTPAATTTMNARGTQNYMSPEAFFPRKFGQVAHKTDVWSVGACVLEMCTGSAPFAALDLTDAEIARELDNETPIAIPENSPFTHVLRRCFTFDQTERPTALELLQSLFVCIICDTAMTGPESGILCQGSPDSFLENKPPHFTCTECLGMHVRTCCEFGGRFEEFDGSPAGRIPCCLFPHGCDDGALPTDDLLVALAENGAVMEAYRSADNRLAVDRYRQDEEERRRLQEDEEAKARNPVHQALLCVNEALTIGQSVKCPGCRNAKRKDDACMHMDCECGVHFCYCCGADRYPGVVGRGADYRPERKVNCGCDTTSIYLQKQPGWSNFAMANRGEDASHGALIEFHRKRMAHFVRVAKDMIQPNHWEQLRAKHPLLLSDLLEGRSIQWEEVDAAEHPRFGTRTSLPIVQEEEERFIGEWRRKPPTLVREFSGVDSATFRLIPDDDMRGPIQEWIRTAIFRDGRCNCAGTSVRDANVTSVSKIRNPFLKRHYDVKKREIQAFITQHGSAAGSLAHKTHQPNDDVLPLELDTSINEVYLFHGTNGDTARHVAEFGFDERVSNLGGLYGAGSYFADAACKSNWYTGRDSIRVFLVCRVIMGLPYCTRTVHNDAEFPTRRPPAISTIPGRPHDSIFAETGVANDGQQEHNEYVVFDRYQVYPEYLVEFTVPVEDDLQFQQAAPMIPAAPIPVPIPAPSPAAPMLNQLSGDESEEEMVVERENEQADGDDFFLENQLQFQQAAPMIPAAPIPVPIPAPSPAAPMLNQLFGDEGEEEMVVERENEQADGDDFFLENQAQSLQAQEAELQDDGQLVLEEEEIPSDEREDGGERGNDNADDLLLDGQAQSLQEEGEQIVDQVVPGEEPIPTLVPARLAVEPRDSLFRSAQYLIDSEDDDGTERAESTQVSASLLFEDDDAQAQLPARHQRRLNSLPPTLVGEDAGDIPELLSRDDISEDVAQSNAAPQDGFYQFVVSDDANILFNITLPLHAPWTDMRSQLQLYTPIYGVRYSNPRQENAAEVLVRNEEEWTQCWAVMMEQEDRRMQIQVQKMPPVKMYRISVDVGADGKKKKISYANEYDFDVTLRIIVDSEYMTVRQDHVVIPKRDKAGIIVKIVPMQSPRKETVSLILEEQDSGIQHTLRLIITWS